MALQLVLARPTRRRLVRLDRKTRDADLRIRIRVVFRVAEGLSCRAAAQALGCAFSTAARIVARFRRHGEASLLDGRSDNGSRKVDADVRAGILTILEHRPPAYDFRRPTWTLELIAQAIARELHLTLSLGHLCRVLHRVHVRWGRPRPVVACPWKRRRRQRRIAQLRRLAANPARGEVISDNYYFRPATTISPGL